MRAHSLRNTFVIVLVSACLAGCAEYLPFSGGALEGSVTPIPDDWGEVAMADIIQFETNPQDPYSVNLWVLGMDDILYVHAGANRAEWIVHIETDPNVRLGYAGQIYELRAERTLDQAEFDRFADIYEEKYGNRPRNENVNEAYLMRLLPREN